MTAHMGRKRHDRSRQRGPLGRCRKAVEELRLGTAKWNPFRELASQRETARTGIQTSTVQAAGVYLPVAAPTLGSSGVVIGTELHSGRAFIYDPFILYGDRLPAGHVLLLGRSGRGKSSCAKTYVMRQLAFRDRAFAVLDAQGDGERGEWDDIASELGITPVRITPGVKDGVRVNPLDASIPDELQLMLLRAIVELSRGTDLGTDERFALKVALERGRAAAGAAGRVPVLSDVLAALTAPLPAQLGEREIDAMEMLAWGEGPALALDELIDGPLGGSFDGETSTDIDLEGRLVIFDLSSVDRSSAALPILMAILSVWLRWSWITPGDGVRRTLIVEEAWDIIRHTSVADLFLELLKYGRRLGLSLWFVMHHISDSDVSPAAKAILKLTDTRVIYGLNRDEAEETAKALQLPDWATATISDPAIMRPGTALWAVGARSMLVQHKRTSYEVAVTNTNKGMQGEAA
jgi:hypothetical protein